MQKALTVAEAPRELGCSKRWLREAERKGKIPKARRDLNNWRAYTLEDIAMLREMLIPSKAPDHEIRERGSQE